MLPSLERQKEGDKVVDLFFAQILLILAFCAYYATRDLLLYPSQVRCGGLPHSLVRSRIPFFFIGSR
jgi:hypothetical protein